MPMNSAEVTEVSISRGVYSSGMNFLFSGRKKEIASGGHTFCARTDLCDLCAIDGGFRLTSA